MSGPHSPSHAAVTDALLWTHRSLVALAASAMDRGAPGTARPRVERLHGVDAVHDRMWRLEREARETLGFDSPPEARDVSEPDLLMTVQESLARDGVRMASVSAQPLD